MESPVPLNLSPICSVVLFSESGYGNEMSIRPRIEPNGTHLQGGGSLVGHGLAASVGHGDDD